MKTITWGLMYWPFFLIYTTLLFAIPELIALFTNARNTLSDYSWYELHLRTGNSIHTWAWYVSLAGWLLAVIILTGHIWFRNPS